MAETMSEPAIHPSSQTENHRLASSDTMLTSRSIPEKLPNGAANDPLANMIFEHLRIADNDNTGKVTFDQFAMVFAAENMGAAITYEDAQNLFEELDEENTGSILYTNNLSNIVKSFIEKLKSADDTDSDWIEVYSLRDGILYFNKTTRHTQFELPESYVTAADEIVADAFSTHFAMRDPNLTGKVDFNTFCIDLQTDQLGFFLTPDEVEAIIHAHPPIDEEGTMEYITLAPLLRNYITQLYAGRQPHPGHWVRLLTRQYVPKSKPEDKRRIHELMEEVLQLRRLTDGTASHKIQKAECSVQTDDNGTLKQPSTTDKQLLDSTLIAKEHLEKELAEVKKELKQKSLEFSAKSETTISKLEEQLQQTKLELEARQRNCTQQEEELSNFEKHIAELSPYVEKHANLEKRVVTLETKLKETTALCEERSKSLTSARNQIKALKEQSSRINEDSAEVKQLRDRLHEYEELHRTNKAFLDSKTKLLQQKNDRIRLLEARLASLDEQNGKRSSAVARVLDRTSVVQ
eukprot:gene9370-10384_t